MKARTFKRHIVESFKSLKRNGWMSIASISAVTVTLLLVGVFMAVLLNLSKVASDVENNVRVRVIINDKATKKDRADLKDKIEKLADVSKVKFSSKDQELDGIVKGYGQEFKLFKGDDNPLRDVYEVSAKTPAATKAVSKKIKNYKFVDDASYGANSADNLFAAISTAQRWGLGISVLLLFVAVFLISNTIRITIFSRRSEIEIMRLVGAKNGFIRWPFLLEGAWIGLLGAVLPIALVNLGYLWVYKSFTPTLESTTYALLTPGQFLLQINCLLAGIGIVIGSIGSAMSMRRFLKI